MKLLYQSSSVLKIIVRTALVTYDIELIPLLHVAICHMLPCTH